MRVPTVPFVVLDDAQRQTAPLGLCHRDLAAVGYGHAIAVSFAASGAGPLLLIVPPCSKTLPSLANMPSPPFLRITHSTSLPEKLPRTTATVVHVLSSKVQRDCRKAQHVVALRQLRQLLMTTPPGGLITLTRPVGAAMVRVDMKGMRKKDVKRICKTHGLRLFGTNELLRERISYREGELANSYTVDSISIVEPGVTLTADKEDKVEIRHCNWKHSPKGGQGGGELAGLPALNVMASDEKAMSPLMTEPTIRSRAVIINSLQITLFYYKQYPARANFIGTTWSACSRISSL